MFDLNAMEAASRRLAELSGRAPHPREAAPRQARNDKIDRERTP
jgi:hypothetical protein